MKEVLCINDVWFSSQTKSATIGPKKNDVCQVVRTLSISGKPYYILSGYPPKNAYITKSFVDLIPTEILEAELASISQPALQ